MSARYEIAVTAHTPRVTTRAVEGDLTNAIEIAFALAEGFLTDGPRDDLPPADRVRVQITRIGVITTEILDATLTPTNPGEWQ